MTRHRRGPRSVGLVLDAAREQWAPETVLAEVQRNWHAAVGSAIAAEARPSSEHAGVLTVSCSASVWAHELDLMGPAIIERLNARIRRGQVMRLRCVAVDQCSD